MRADINISTTDQSGNKQTNKLSYVNPEATEQQYATLIDKVVAMSNNILVSAAKVETSEINLNASSLQAPNLSLSNTGITKTTTYRWSEVKRFTMDGENGSAIVNISQASPYESQIPYVKSNATSVPVAVSAVRSAETGNLSKWSVFLAAGTGYDNVTDGDTLVPSLYGDIVIAVDPTDTYAGDEVTITIVEG